MFGDEHDPPPVQTFGDVGKSFEHERIVPLVGLGIIIHQSKHDQQWLLQLVGLADRIFQRVIKPGSLGLLHPILDIITIATDGACVQFPGSFGLDHARMNHTSRPILLSCPSYWPIK